MPGCCGRSRLRDHTIVCGLGSTGRQVVDSFRDAGRQVVVVALNADTPDAAACERRHIAVLEGDAGQAAVLKLAGLKHANSLVVACGSDGANLEIGMRARDTLRGLTDRTVKILPELRSEWLYDLVKTQNAGALDSPRPNSSSSISTSMRRACCCASDVFQQPLPQVMPQPASAVRRLRPDGRGNAGARGAVQFRRCRRRNCPPPSWMSAGPPASPPPQVRAAGHPRISPISPSVPASSRRRPVLAGLRRWTEINSGRRWR